MYGSTTTGLSTLPAAGAAFGSLTLFLAGLTIFMVFLAVMRLMPKTEV